MSAGYPLVPNAGVQTAGMVVTGNTMVGLFQAPLAQPSATPPASGGTKFGKFIANSTDPTAAGNWIQVFRVIGATGFTVGTGAITGGTALPEGDPVQLPAAVAKGNFNSVTVDLLAALYPNGQGGSVPMNLQAGEILAVQLSVATASGKNVSFLLANGANF